MQNRIRRFLPLIALALAACDESPNQFAPQSVPGAAAGQAGQAGQPAPLEAWEWSECGVFVPPDDTERTAREERQVFGVSISPDAATMVVTDVYTASAYRIAPDFQASTLLWQSDTGLELTSEFSPDGSMVAISGDGRQLLAADTGARLFGPIPPPGINIGCNQAYFRFSHDGRFVAGGGYQFGVDVYDVSGHALAATLASQGCDSAAAFSPDDSLIATGKPELYRASDFTRIWPESLEKDPPDQFAWATWVQFISEGKELVVSTCRAEPRSPDGRQFACDHVMHSVETGAAIGRSGEPTSSFAVLSQDGRFYVDTHSVYDRLRSGDSLLRAEQDIHAAAFAPNGDVIAAVKGGSLHRFCARHGSQVSAP